MQSLYIHMPFCRNKCNYCNFFSIEAELVFSDPYVDSVISELRSRSAVVSGPVKTLYIGGGTPSVFTPGQIKRIISEIEVLFGFDNPEITLEVNPGTIDKNNALELAKIGVNRISIGAQSFIDEELKMLGRIHSAKQARDAVRFFYVAGITNLSLDLMFGLPGQAIINFTRSIEAALELPIKHISTYCLQFELGTELDQRVAIGELVGPDEELQLEMYDMLRTKLRIAGFAHYEISNFSLPGYKSIHNSNYWNYEDFLGLGAGATSMVSGVRYTNTRDIDAYLHNPLTVVSEKEQLSLPIQISESLFMGLRQLEGIDLTILSGRFSTDIAAIYQNQLSALESQGLIEISGSNVRLSESGITLSNEVFEKFIS